MQFPSRSMWLATALVSFSCLAPRAHAAADPVPPLATRVVPQIPYQGVTTTVSSAVGTINAQWGTNKYLIVEVLKAGAMEGYENETVRGLGPGVPPNLPSGDTELLMTDGQFMHVYVKSSGPLQHQPLAQWGTIVGTFAFVICMVVRVFFKRG